MPPKRRQVSGSQRPVKRQRTLFIKIGEANPDDKLNDAQRSAQQPSSSALSTRHIGPNAVPSLVRLSMERFAQNAVKLNEDAFLQSRVVHKLADLPTHLVQPLFAFLREYCPTRLSDEFIRKYFLRGDHLVFTEDMTGVLNRTIRGIQEAPDFAQGLKVLELRGQPDLKDNVVASTISHLPALVTLVLRGCNKVGSKSVLAAAATCHELEIVNLNYTSTGYDTVRRLLQSCEKLHTLKLAGLSSLNDTHVMHALGHTWARLRRLKLRQTPLRTSGDVVTRALSSSATSLDISFTSLVFNELPRTLEKLSLMATPTPAALLPRLLKPLTSLRKLSLALLGNQTPSLSDESLKRLIPVLESYQNLVDLNLASNTKLGLNGTGGIARLLESLGSRLEVLNLSGIPRLRWYDLEPLQLMPEAPPLRVLLLMNTGIDDSAASCIAACRNLQHLNLAGTGLSTEGVGAIVDACPKLGELDLTGCRGVRVQDRRRFFEVWAERRRERSESYVTD